MAIFAIVGKIKTKVQTIFSPFQAFRKGIRTFIIFHRSGVDRNLSVPFAHQSSFGTMEYKKTISKSTKISCQFNIFKKFNFDKVFSLDRCRRDQMVWFTQFF